jgi:hypothetical protein
VILTGGGYGIGLRSGGLDIRLIVALLMPAASSRHQRQSQGKHTAQQRLVFRLN